ncbi:uncharacterized protein [Triticum aestivum]|uniref:uncharacterized protein n=1 Tax=Triticum aestivum TaxID=4565 RepID=UPI001D02B154|nr:uncharacterized protein LOC123066609 [Triticum aestivum]
MRARGASWKRCGSGHLGAGRVPVRLRAHRDSRPRASLPHLLREGAPSSPTWSVAPAWEGQTVGVEAVVDFFKAKIKHLHLRMAQVMQGTDGLFAAKKVRREQPRM